MRFERGDAVGPIIVQAIQDALETAGIRRTKREIAEASMNSRTLGAMALRL